MPDSPKVYVNGINAVTGQYLFEPKTVAELAMNISGEEDRSLLRWLQRIWTRLAAPHLGFDLDPTDPAQAGWGIVFHENESDLVKQALEPLVRHRREKIGNDDLVKVLEYRQGEQLKDWLGRYHLAPGSKDPTLVPYYLLLVGSPDKIPFLFGHHLDLEYAVGRLDFERPVDYAAYADSLIDYETSTSVPNGREVVFFGTRHKFDNATQLSADQLVAPLADGMPGSGPQLPQPGVAQEFNFQARKLWGADALKAALTEVFCPAAGVKPPAFLFSATHGMGWPSGDKDQLAKQGALLCQDWPGFGKISPDHYFAASDMPPDAHVHGLVAFHFACYGAGTPASDRFIHEAGHPPPAIAPKPFTAALPRTLLTHANGSALAVIGHVERAWGYSIETAEAGTQIRPFRNTIGRILYGLPVGYAVKDFNERYASLSASLNATLEEKGYGAKVPETELVTAWIEKNDSEGYVILGDPAVCLRVNDLS
jgi:hypothetical protein